MNENVKINSEAIFEDTEMINIWFGMLLRNCGKRFVNELSISEIKAEIEEIKGTIENEQLWALAEPIHEGNVSTLKMYLDKLYEILNRLIEYNNQACKKITKPVEYAISYISKLPEWYNKTLIADLTDDEIRQEIDKTKKDIKESEHADAEYLESLRIYIDKLNKILDERKNGGK